MTVICGRKEKEREVMEADATGMQQTYSPSLSLNRSVRSTAEAGPIMWRHQSRLDQSDPGLASECLDHASK